MKIPLAVPGKSAYRRLRSLLDCATDPAAEVVIQRNTTPKDVLGSAFRVRLKSRHFRASPKLFAFLQFGIGGQMLRFHPFEASAGEHEFRISKRSGLAYLTEPRTGRTWVFTLEPFRSARRAGKEASAVAMAAPFGDLETARWCAPRLMQVARWLKSQHQDLPAPSRDGQPLPVELSGRVVAGLHMIDPVTGRQLVTLRSHSLRAGQACLTVQKEALQLAQGSTVVYFPVKDLLARWGNQLTRSAIYTSAEAARRRAAELAAHQTLARLIAQTLDASREPTAELLNQLEAFSNGTERVCSDRKGSIGLALALPKRLGGPRRISFRLCEFGPRARLVPSLWWVPHQGLMALWSAADGSVAAFGVTRHEVRRFGVFQSAEAARKAALLNPAVLVRESALRRREQELGEDLRARIAEFNSTDLSLKADNGQLPVPNVLTGAIHRFQTPSSRRLWSPKILLSPAGPLWVLFAKSSARHPAWRVYGPLSKESAGSQFVTPCAEGRGRPTLDTLAVLLSKQLSIRVTAVGHRVGTAATLDDMHFILRRVVPDGLRNWHHKDRDAQVRLFYEIAEGLREALLSVDEARRRAALVATEYFYFGKPTEQIMNLHAPLFKPDSGVWSAVLGEGGCADARAKEMVRSLGSFVFERPKKGLPATMHTRFSKFQGAVIELGAAQSGS